MMQEFRVTVETMTETYEYYPLVDTEQCPDPDKAEHLAELSGVSLAILDGLNERDWYHARVEFL